MIPLETIATEARNDASAHFDEATTLERMRIINRADQDAPAAVEKIVPEIARACDAIAARMKDGGRLIYAGAGTSGRLGVLDAAECPPTYGTDPGRVIGLIAGGRAAMFAAQEGAEDAEALGAKDLAALHLTRRDAVVALAASGRTPYAIGALRYAKKIGALAIALSCCEGAPLAAIADLALTPVTGAEVVTGSTRMKAGTAQKLVLNMLSTGAMASLGKLYGNLMVDLRATNEKLKERARRIVMEAAGIPRAEAIDCLARADGSAKLAILLARTGITPEAGRARLKETASLREAIEQERAGV